MKIAPRILFSMYPEFMSLLILIERSLNLKNDTNTNNIYNLLYIEIMLAVAEKCGSIMNQILKVEGFPLYLQKYDNIIKAAITQHLVYDKQEEYKHLFLRISSIESSQQRYTYEIDDSIKLIREILFLIPKDNISRFVDFIDDIEINKSLGIQAIGNVSIFSLSYYLSYDNNFYVVSISCYLDLINKLILVFDEDPESINEVKGKLMQLLTEINQMKEKTKEQEQISNLIIIRERLHSILPIQKSLFCNKLTTV